MKIRGRAKREVASSVRMTKRAAAKAEQLLEAARKLDPDIEIGFSDLVETLIEDAWTKENNRTDPY